MIQTRYPGRPSFNLRFDSHLERSQMPQFASYREFLEWPKRSNFGGLLISQTGSSTWAIVGLLSLLCLLCLFCLRCLFSQGFPKLEFFEFLELLAFFTRSVFTGSSVTMRWVETPLSMKMR